MKITDNVSENIRICNAILHSSIVVSILEVHGFSEKALPL